VAGSLIGIWLFVALSAWGLPPVAWFAVFAALALYFVTGGVREKVTDLALLGLILAAAGLAGWEANALESHWSPYQKLVTHVAKADADRAAAEPAWWGQLKGRRKFSYPPGGQYVIMVNNFGYQNMIDLDPARVAADPERFDPKMRGYSQYDLPAKCHPNPRKMLIVGAGSGNDVAGALRNGAEEVVAVEIDPVIIELGKKYHPEKPYADPRVRVVNDDARSYFATSTDKFDVIVFGLLDSHTTTAMTNARLDHYVYTRESIQHAASLLNKGGVIVLSFWSEKAFITDRMATVLAEVFEHKPLTFVLPTSAYGWGGMQFVTGDRATIEGQLAADGRLRELIDEWQKAVPITFAGTTKTSTDDWPYLYLEHPRVPVLYFLLGVLLVVLFVRGLRKLEGPAIVRGWTQQSWHFFFLGAAFMLLEVQNISKAAVVLGNTWVVNAVIISGILAMVLLANGLAAAWPRFPVGLAYAGLVGSCLGLFFLDLSRFAFLPYASKALIVGGLTSLPMLFSGLVFVRSFAAAEHKDLALGANLFGSLVGALLQTVTFVIGIKALLLIVAALYVLALSTRPRPGVEAPGRLVAEPIPA
jgi:spermidine synthase